MSKSIIKDNNVLFIYLFIYFLTKMASKNRPEILILSLPRRSLRKDLSFVKIAESASLKRATTAGEAIRYVEESNAKAIS